MGKLILTVQLNRGVKRASQRMCIRMEEGRYWWVISPYDPDTYEFGDSDLDIILLYDMHVIEGWNMLVFNFRDEILP